jgi:hypothetical protein
MNTMTAPPKRKPNPRSNLGHAEVRVYGPDGQLRKILKAKPGPNAGYNSRWNQPKRSKGFKEPLDY